MIDLNSQSYPWLGVAQFFNVPYGEVLALVDDLDAGRRRVTDWLAPDAGGSDWAYVVCNRWAQRQAERGP